MSSGNLSSLSCPSCRKALKLKLLSCDDCGVRVEGDFRLNEFATLPPEDLHFLRVFIQSEGRIRDMETALGLSYPTIRTRLSALKEKLSPEKQDVIPKDDREEQIRKILNDLSEGKVVFENALEQIKQIKKGKG